MIVKTGKTLRNTSKKQKKSVRKDVVVNSIAEVDLSDLRIPIIAVYKYPSDYPESCVARVFDVDIATNVVMVKETIDEIEKDIQEHTGTMFFNRGKEDVQSLVGVWL